MNFWMRLNCFWIAVEFEMLDSREVKYLHVNLSASFHLKQLMSFES